MTAMLNSGRDAASANASGAPPLPGYYVAGGALPVEAECYIPRNADTALFGALRAGRLSYVLTSRQMGKSSLRTRTAARLRAEGIRVAQVDLQRIGQNLTVEQWYVGLLDQIAEQLRLEDELDAFIEQHRAVAPLQQWLRFLQRVVLAPSSDLVVFVDEIDAVRSLPFSTDEFFASIRSLHDLRADDIALRRLTFCLLGSSTPSDLIRDRRITPFNVGQRIDLEDFTPEEALPLGRGLHSDETLARRLLERVLYWTGGHPYLTQRVCRELEGGRHPRPEDVDRTCEALFFGRESVHEPPERPHLLQVSRELIGDGERERIASRLEQYRQVRAGRRVRYDPHDATAAALHLSGITRVVGSELRVRNRLYAREFDHRWVRRNMPDSQLQRLLKRYYRLLAAASISIILAVVAVMGWDQATRQGLAYRRLLYNAQMNLAAQAWEKRNVARLRELLPRHVPKEGEKDLRGFEWYFLHNLAHQAVIEHSYPDMVRAVAYSPDGAVIASGGTDGILRIFDSATGRVLKQIPVERGPIYQIAFSSRSGLLAISHQDGSVTLRDARSMREVRSFAPAMPVAEALAFAPDDRTLYVGGGAPFLRRIAVETGAELPAIQADQHGIYEIGCSPDGRFIATIDTAGAVKLWDAKTGAQERRLEGADDRIDSTGLWSVAFSPDSNQIATGSMDSLYVWDVPSGRLLHRTRYLWGKIQSLAFTPDGEALLVGAGDGFMRLIDVRSWRIRSELGGHSRGVHAIDIAPDGAHVATGSLDRTVRVWDLRKSSAWATLDAHRDWASATFFHATPPSGVPRLRLISTSFDRTVRIWDPLEAKEVAPVWNMSAQPYDLAVSSTGIVAIAEGQSAIRLWDLKTGLSTVTLDWEGEHPTWVRFTPDAKQVIAGGEQPTVRVWDAETGRLTAAIRTSFGRVLSVAISPNSSRLLLGELDRHWIEVRDLSTYKEVGRLGPANATSIDGTSAMALSADGAVLAVAGLNKQIALWDWKASHVKAVLDGHSGRIFGLAFSPDGRRLASSSLDGEVKFWDVQSGDEVMSFKIPDTFVSSLEFSPDGRLLAMGCRSGKILLASGGPDALPPGTAPRVRISLAEPASHEER